ncbi:TRAP transporter small permease [Roseibium aggregatum]|uniref:TRAP transporter small permease protein n=1 Tax=Roseibium aggregatum TaxID=187304 RepID=A0A939J4F3_9HYPH|nr:TRAP transporter small permease subunit [Roseibium aggregatum]MBN9673513.1 TRAP transporter small permease subunit [Roseibium aggregatum]
MKSVNEFARRFFAFGAGLSMALVFAIIFVNSLRRYTVGQSVAWGEELPIYLTIYGVMFGMAFAYMQDRHIRFTVVTDFLSPMVQKKLFAAVDLVSTASGIALAFSGYAFATRRGHIDASGLKSAGRWLVETTGIEGLVWISRIGTWQFAIAVGGALLAVAATLKFIERMSSSKAVGA